MDESILAAAKKALTKVEKYLPYSQVPDNMKRMVKLEDALEIVIKFYNKGRKKNGLLEV